jgi:hypothetical protein
MSQINLPKPDKFYLLFAFMMLVGAVYVVYVFRTVFQAVTTSADIGTQFTEVELKINKDKLDRAVIVAGEKKVLNFEVR